MEELLSNHLFTHFNNYYYFLYVCDVVNTNTSVKVILENFNKNFKLNITVKEFKNNFDILFVNQDINLKVKLTLVSMILLTTKLDSKNYDYNNIKDYLNAKNYKMYSFINSCVCNNKIKYKYGCIDINDVSRVNCVIRTLN